MLGKPSPIASGHPALAVWRFLTHGYLGPLSASSKALSSCSATESTARAFPIRWLCIILFTFVVKLVRCAHLSATAPLRRCRICSRSSRNCKKKHKDDKRSWPRPRWTYTSRPGQSVGAACHDYQMRSGLASTRPSSTWPMWDC